ncbi:MAG: tetratricopeptide repeat protein [Candidatus Sumerlaeia bacterium]|nr:tetratricopeptide repeat protein [Candidatus Sumerlaeia bacterium]
MATPANILKTGRAIAAAVVWIAGASFCTSCTRLPQIQPKPDVVFPRLDSAREQFHYAANFDANTLVGGDAQKGEQRLLRIIAAYQMVADHFPDDPIYTPLAKAGIANCYFKMKRYRKAIALFKDLQEQYPNYPFIHAEAEWKIGRAYDLLGKSAEAKRHYKQCIDTFSRSRNEQIQTIVAACRQYYIQPSIPQPPRPR